MKPFNQINQTLTAQKKLKNLAKNSNLDIEFVRLLANYCWDFDPCGREDTGWVQKQQIDPKQLKKDKQILADILGINPEFSVDKQFLITQIISYHQEKDSQALKDNFLIAGKTKNYPYLSEYATYYYLNNLSVEKLGLLETEKTYDFNLLIRYLFCKIFRGGSVDRSKLFYCYCDLCLDLPYQHQIMTKDVKKSADIDNWIDKLLDKIQKLEQQINKKSTLNDLIKCCQSIIKGDKYFKQEILQALSYSGDLKVQGIDVQGIFIPELKDELAPHFYSNDWSYPLRFWN